MRFILKFLIIWWFLCSFVYASEYIDVWVSEENITMGERVQLNISVNASEITLDAVQFEIPGIDSFDVFSQSQSESYSNINGEIQRSILYSLDIAPNTTGKFPLWPVILTTTSEVITDDAIITLQVWDVLSNLKTITPPSNEGEVVWIQDEQEPDIKWLRIPELSPWIILVWFISFILLFYILLRSVLTLISKEETTPSSIPEISHSDVREQYRKYFIDLKKQVGSISSKDIFRRYNSGIRKILVWSWYSSAETDTLTQLLEKEGIWKQEIFQLFKKSYKYEYSDGDVSSDTQKKYIDDILQSLK